MHIAAQIVGFIASVIMIVAVQSDQKKYFLSYLILCNFLFALTFVLLIQYAGATASLLSAIQSVVVYEHEKRGKNAPKWLVVILIIAILVAGLFTYTDPYSILPILCTLLFASLVLTKDMRLVRIETLIAMLLWSIYDFVSGAYTIILSDGFTIASTLIAMIRYGDFKKK